MLREKLDQKQIARLLPGSTFDRGREYWLRGRVDALAVSGDGTLVSARVQGSGRKVYTTNVRLHFGPTLRVDGRCSCPMSYNCKHVAASLLKAIAEQQAPAGETVPSRPVAISHQTQDWLTRIGNTARGDDYPPEIVQRLLYVVQADSAWQEMAHLSLQLVSVRLLKDGRFSDKDAVVGTVQLDPARAPKFYRDVDIDILQRLESSRAAPRPSGRKAFRSIDLLRQIIATGRAYWRDREGAPLSWGPERHGRIEWRLTTSAGLRPYVVVDGAETMNAEPPVYVDTASGMIGSVTLNLSPRLAYQMLLAPPIPASEAIMVADRLARSLPNFPRDMLPAPPEPARRIDESPVPILRLGTAHGSGMRYFEPPAPWAFAQLSFRYGPAELGSADTAARVDMVYEGRLLEIIRSPKLERAARDLVSDLGLFELRELYPYAGREYGRQLILHDGDEWLEFVRLGVEQLQVAGFEVEIAPDFPYRLATSTGVFDAEIESSGFDWFELALGIEVDGERHDLAPLLAQMLRNPRALTQIATLESDEDAQIYMALGDGRHVALAGARFARLLLALQAIGVGSQSVSAAGRVRLSRADVLPMIGSEDGFAFQGADKLRGLARALHGRGLVAPELPPGFIGTLRPYQAQGVAWLDLLSQNGLGGILADDMGLGKTVQVLALLALHKVRGNLDGPVLIVAPTSLMGNWTNEARKFVPELKVLLLHGVGRKQAFASIGEHDIVFTTYPLIARDQATLLAIGWHMAILDEAQTIKNPNATITRLLAGIKARHRFCMTGTPMENHLGELWSLMHFANPGFLGDKTAFARGWRTPIEKNGDQLRATALARRVKPFLLRRTKGEVAADLPDKIEIVETILIEGKQRDLYDSVRLAMSAKVRDALRERGLAKSHIIVLEALLRLRQACCDPRLLKLDDGVERPSAKLARLMEMVAELRSEGRRIIIFSQFTSMLELIRVGLDGAGVSYSLLTGDTKDRTGAVERFQGGATDVFLISLKAGGVGLNLTAADTVIIFDPWWNPAVEEQAIDRAYRIGQDKTVFVYRLVAEGTIEDKMGELKARKRALADGIVGPDGQIGAALSEADVVALFAE